MALDLKPLTEEVIQTMGYTSHDLWLVKVEAEIYGPFEVASLKDYAAENEKEFVHAFASLMDANDWQPFFTHFQMQPTKTALADRFWILDQGQKVGPLDLQSVQKKIEMGILSMSDVVSTDEGHTWTKIVQDPTFNPGFVGGVESLPHSPTESSFLRAKEELTEWMDSHDRTGPHSGLASLMYMGQKKENEKTSLKLEEMDLGSLNETEVSRSLKWAIPAAVAGVAVLAVVGKFLLSPSAPELTQNEEKFERILPPTEASMPNPGRMPASYNIQNQQRSGLMNAPTLNQNAYPPTMHTETHFKEAEPALEQVDNETPNPEAEEHSLVSNKPQIGTPEGSLDQAMSGGESEAPPEAPVIEEATDF